MSEKIEIDLHSEILWYYVQALDVDYDFSIFHIGNELLKNARSSASRS